MCVCVRACVCVCVCVCACVRVWLCAYPLPHAGNVFAELTDIIKTLKKLMMPLTMIVKGYSDVALHQHEAI